MVIRLFLQQWTFQNFTYRVHNRHVKWVPVLFSNNKITTNCYRDFLKISQHNIDKLWKYQIWTVHLQSLTVRMKIYIPRVGLVIVIFDSCSTAVKFKVWIGPEVRDGRIMLRRLNLTILRQWTSQLNLNFGLCPKTLKTSATHFQNKPGHHQCCAYFWLAND